MIEGIIILLGYPRSGNTWLRYIIECLYNKPSVGPLHLNNDGTPVIDKTLNSVIGYNFPEDITINKMKCLIHCHLVDVSRGDTPIPRMIRGTPPMIFVLRDYKDCVYRQVVYAEDGDGEPEFSNENKNERMLTLYEKGLYTSNQQGGYIPTLDYFDKYKGKKILVKYEDLIDNKDGIKKTLKKLNIFLGIKNNGNIIKFLDKIDIHTQNSMKNYERFYATKTKGVNKAFYKNIVGEEIFRNIDEMVKNRNPDLFEKYLEVYKIK